MQQRAIALIVPLILGLAGATVPTSAPAQAPAVSDSMDSVARLASLARERARRWAAARPIIYCAPAPLTERPTAAAEFARPRLAPLEAEFYDAAAVKRALAALGRRG